MINIDITIGEYCDRLSILYLKTQRIKDCSKAAIATAEYNYFLSKSVPIDKELYKELLEVNEKLWDIEEQIRTLEKKGQWDAAFIECARLIPVLNGQRSLIKNRISNKFGEAVEVKSHDK